MTTVSRKKPGTSPKKKAERVRKNLRIRSPSSIMRKLFNRFFTPNPTHPKQTIAKPHNVVGLI